MPQLCRLLLAVAGAAIAVLVAAAARPLIRAMLLCTLSCKRQQNRVTAVNVAAAAAVAAASSVAGSGLCWCCEQQQ
jgi:hypothetical protein